MVQEYTAGAASDDKARAGPSVGDVDIIVAAFNAHRWVCDAIDSALAQTYARVRVVVVDDGSTDGTADLLRGRYGARIDVIESPHRGLAAARNEGIRSTSGEFLQFLDADDLLSTTKIEQQIARFRADPACALVHCAFDQFDDGVPGSRRPAPPSFVLKCEGQDPWRALLSGNFIPPLTPLVRRDAVTEAGGFDESLEACEDYDLWLRLAAHGCRFSYLPKVLASYRLHPDSMSQNRVRQLSSTIAVHRRVTDRGRCLAGDERSIVRRYRAEIHEQLSVEWRRQGARVQAIRHAITAACYRPSEATRILAQALRVSVSGTT